MDICSSSSLVPLMKGESPADWRNVTTLPRPGRVGASDRERNSASRSFSDGIASGQRGGETFFANPLLAVTLIVASLSAISGLALGLFSFVRRKERSLLVLIAVVLGLFVQGGERGEIVDKVQAGPPVPAEQSHGQSSRHCVQSANH